jgi:YesN/AraC family two-component response regulator
LVRGLKAMIKLDMMNAHELLKDMTILYVDDDEDALEIVNEHLSTKIKKLYTSSNPLDAIDKYKSIRPDIIITDIRMPIMNGFEMIKKIREMAPMVKVIYTSAY